LSELRYHRDYMLLPTVSQDTLGQWEGMITIKHKDDNALAADYKTEGTYATPKDGVAAALELGRLVIDSGKHEDTVQRKAQHWSKLA